jgi:TonB-dependent receptor
VVDFDYTKSIRRNLDVSLIGGQFADEYIDLGGKYPTVIPHKPNQLPIAGPRPTPRWRVKPTPSISPTKNQFWRAAMDHQEYSTGQEFAFKNDWSYKFDSGSFLKSIKFGGRFADRRQTVRYSTYNWGMLSETWSGSAPVTVSNVGGSNVSFYNFSNFFRGQTTGPVGGWYYNGDLINDYGGFVNFANKIENYGKTNYGTNSTWVPLAARAGANADGYLPSEVQPITQRDVNAYIQANFGSNDPTFLGMKVSGNIGVRFVDTEVRSSGSIGTPTQTKLGVNQSQALRCAAQTITLPNGTSITKANTTGVCAMSATQYAQLQQWATGATFADTQTNHYQYFLPSLNLKFGIDNDKIIRFAASKVLTRPENDYLRDYLDIGQTGTAITATAGNPKLKPATAWQFDLTAEWYFSRVGSLTFDLFYKDVTGFFYQSVVNRDITNNGITETVAVRSPANYSGHGKVKGFELAYQQTLTFLPGPLKNLGFSGNYTYIDSQGLPNSFLNGGSPQSTSTVKPGNLPLEQLSKHNINAQLFYENSKVSARVAYNWRSRFLLTAADVIFPYYSIFNEPTGQMDASVFFNVYKGIKVGVQG